MSFAIKEYLARKDIRDILGDGYLLYKTKILKILGGYILEDYTEYQRNAYEAMAQMDALDANKNYVIYRSENTFNEGGFLWKLFEPITKKIFFLQDEKIAAKDSRCVTLSKLANMRLSDEYKIVLSGDDFFKTFQTLQENGIVSDFGEVMPFGGKTKYEIAYKKALRDVHDENAKLGGD
jgi:hypothetical protein